MSKIRGIISTRRLLKRVPDAIRAELAESMKRAGPQLQGAMVSRAPRASGQLVSGITWKFYPATLRLLVGFIGKPTNRKLFYARILEGGRRTQVVTVQRRKIGRRGLRNGRKKIEDIAATYQLRVKPLAPRRFVYGPLTDLRRAFSRQLNGIWDRALRRVSGGNNE